MADSYDHAPHGGAQKGYDDSPPRNGVIFFYTVLAIVFLVGVDFLLDSYFAKVMDGEIHDKVLTQGLDTAIETRAKERETLEKSGIEAAMRAVAQRGRAASPAITSESGAGKAEGTGWSQLKREVAPAAGSAQPTPPPPADLKVQEGKQPGGQGAPKEGKSPVAPGNRPSSSGANP
jgi:hypothetical protein